MLNRRRLMTLSLLLCVIASQMAATGAQETEVTKANWQQHPKIKAVRAIYQEVNGAISKGTFKTSKREFEYCEPYEDIERRLGVDANGRARYYVTEGGSDDSSLTSQYFYDQRCRLRFVFITGGAVNGSELEHRIYFDESGKRIWEEQKYVKGPGYTFPAVWPDEALQMTDPGKAFNAASKCPEAKKQQGQRRTR